MSMMFFFNDTATTEIYTLSLHDALPISAIEGVAGSAHRRRAARIPRARAPRGRPQREGAEESDRGVVLDRKSTRLNSSHANISYAVFCLTKKNSLLSASPHTILVLSFYA